MPSVIVFLRLLIVTNAAALRVPAYCILKGAITQNVLKPLCQIWLPA